MTLGVGTEMYKAPEVLDSNSYDLPADVYSFGMLLFEMVHRVTPFEDRPLFQIYEDVVEKG